MGKKVRKPIVIGNDSDTIVSLQIASVSVNGVQATPEVCIMFEDCEDNATVALFTPEQIIPEELQTDEAKAIFGKAIKSGLMVRTETECYHWEKSTALLAYFCDVMSENLNLKASNGNIKWTLFKPLFGIDKKNNSLRDAVNEYKNKTGQNPDGSKIIDSIF